MSWQLFNKDIAQVAQVKVMVDGKAEWVDIHPMKGPLVNNPDGSQTDMRWLANSIRAGKWDNCQRGEGNQGFRTWHSMTSTEQELALHAVAKKNRKLKEWQKESGSENIPGAKMPDFLAMLPYFIARNKEIEQQETERWLAEKMNNIGIKEKAPSKSSKEQKKH